MTSIELLVPLVCLALGGAGVIWVRWSSSKLDRQLKQQASTARTSNYLGNQPVEIESKLDELERQVRAESPSAEKLAEAYQTYTQNLRVQKKVLDFMFLIGGRDEEEKLVGNGGKTSARTRKPPKLER